MEPRRIEDVLLHPVHNLPAACQRAATEERNGTPGVIRPRVLGRVPHDFRRTAARNLIRAGVPQHVVMKRRGWKTDGMFRRHAIVDEHDLRDAVGALAKGTTGGQAAATGTEGGQ